MHSRAAYPGQDTDTAGLEDAAAFRKRAVIDEIIDHVVTLIAFCVVLLRIVDHVIGADRADQVQVFCAADAGNLGAISLGNLDGKCPDASGGTIDQDLLSCFHPRGVAQAL